MQLAMDAALVLSSFLTAMYLRLDSFDFLARPKLWQLLIIAVTANLIAFWIFGLYRTLIRTMSADILPRVAKGAFFGAISLYIFSSYLNIFMPRSVPIMIAVLLFLTASGIRFFAKRLFLRQNRKSKKNVIIYGAGNSGRQLLNLISSESDLLPKAFIDDDIRLHNLNVGRLRVYPPSQLARIIDEMDVHIILLAIPSLTNARRLAIVRFLESLPIEIKTVPNLTEIISGTYKISDLRAVSAEDLLGRDPIQPIPELLGRNITGKVVMVTGAGGSIGGELCRQILEQTPKVLVLFELSEFALYRIEAELSAMAQRLTIDTKIVPVLGSIQSPMRIEKAISSNNVNTIYHSAAYKHVPLIEDNVVEAVQNNVFGTLSVLLAARRHGVSNFVMISTDKAVRPTNVMGATKRIAELICQAYSMEPSGPTISMVRFGNVLGSSGSVIPKFKEQIESGGPVTVTHQDVTRYFMTLKEAAQLVIQAGSMSKGGDVFVLDMGEPVRILDLAMEVVRLHGLTPYLIDQSEKTSQEIGDLAIQITGLRKGEKLFEELLIGNNPMPTLHPRIMTAAESSVPLNKLKHFLEDLRAGCDLGDINRVKKLLIVMPLGYSGTEDAVN